MKVKNLFPILAIVVTVSCSVASKQPLSGVDKADITANDWLYQINMHDYFIHFDEYDTGWTGEVENSAQQYGLDFPKQEFVYVIDTIAKTIAIMYKETGEEIKWSYRLEYDNKRILYLDDKPYIDAKDEIEVFSSRMDNLQNSIIDLLQQ